MGGEELFGGCVRRMVKGKVEEARGLGRVGLGLDVVNQLEQWYRVGGAFSFELCLMFPLALKKTYSIGHTYVFDRRQEVRKGSLHVNG